jgi:hypothetical protein
MLCLLCKVFLQFRPAFETFFELGPDFEKIASNSKKWTELLSGIVLYMEPRHNLHVGSVSGSLSCTIGKL